MTAPSNALSGDRLTANMAIALFVSVGHGQPNYRTALGIDLAFTQHAYQPIS